MQRTNRLRLVATRFRPSTRGIPVMGQAQPRQISPLIKPHRSRLLQSRVCLFSMETSSKSLPACRPPVTVTRAQTFFLTDGASPNQSSWNQSVTLLAALYGSQFGVVPTGTVTFYDNGAAVSGTVTYTPNPPGYASAVLGATMPYTPTT